MYLPGNLKKKKEETPFEVKWSRRYMVGAGLVSTITLFTAAAYTLRKFQERNRIQNKTVDRRRPGSRVVIIGGGAGGAALAANLCSRGPSDTNITVIEKDRKQTFQAIVPLAHVGHRSYDINTSGGLDFLRSPASWNVVRDAKLVAGEVVKVMPEQNEVWVRPASGTVEAKAALLASKKKELPTSQGQPNREPLLGEPHSNPSLSPSPLETSASKSSNGDSSQSTEMSAANSTFSGIGDHFSAFLTSLYPRIFPTILLDPIETYDHIDSTGSSLRANEKGSAHQGNSMLPSHASTKNESAQYVVQKDGTALLKVPYDVLVIAAGAERSLGSLKTILSPTMIDRYEIAVNPGVTRDNLSHIYKGNIVHAKVPPTSMVRYAEQRRLAFEKKGLLSPMREAIDLAEAKGNHGFCFSDRVSDASVQGGFNRVLSLATSAINSLLNPQVISTSKDLEKSPPSTNKVHLASIPALLPEEMLRRPWLPARQHDGTFISSTNTIWRYLYYFNKLRLCPLYVINSDEKPSDMVPSAVNDRVLTHWAEFAQNGGFQYFPNSYISHLDTAKSVATIYDMKQNLYYKLPFRLLLLDLPLQAPDFIWQSGLHKGPNHDGQKWGKWLRSTSVVAPLTEEDTFVDVNPQTLQHRRFKNIFSLGDCAGLPTVKSYGGTFSQVPVVSHNVCQVLHNQKMEHLIHQERKRYRCAKQKDLNDKENSSKETVPLSSSDAKRPEDSILSLYSCEEDIGRLYRPRDANALYDGYSSFPVVMTTWRAMWPEMFYPPALAQQLHHETKLEQKRDYLATLKRLRILEEGEMSEPRMPPTNPPSHSSLSDDNALSSSSTSSGDGVADLAEIPALTCLEKCNYHLWDNIAWKGIRGVLNASFYQTSMYEALYFFMMVRGEWSAKHWFYIPSYSPSDGSIREFSLIS